MADRNALMDGLVADFVTLLTDDTNPDVIIPFLEAINNSIDISQMKNPSSLKILESLLELFILDFNQKNGKS